jgi:hypothetical protein
VNLPGTTEELLSHLFWANAVPDAEANVNLTINGTSLAINDAIGYHDKNWGDASIITSPRFWDWGHARFGPYSVVWYDLLDKNNTERVSGYVAKHGKILEASCGETAVQVRQWGPSTTYPPAAGLPSVQGVFARFDLGNGDVLVANVTKDLIVHAEGSIYARALGSVKGGIEHQETFEGRAFFEEWIMA